MFSRKAGQAPTALKLNPNSTIVIGRMNQSQPPIHEETGAPASSAPKPASSWRELASTISVLVVAILVAIGLIAFVFQSYQVDGPSMEATLQNNDRLIVWKAPRTIAKITGHAYVPNRGDIIVFVENGLASYGQPGDHQLIKRVIGLPGDRVVVNNNTITIYNAAHPQGFEPDKTLPYSKTVNLPPTSGNIDVTLAKDQLFVCGDNRTESLDSRTFGPISLNDVVGKLVVRLLPLSKAERF